MWLRVLDTDCRGTIVRRCARAFVVGLFCCSSIGAQEFSKVVPVSRERVIRGGDNHVSGVSALSVGANGLLAVFQPLTRSVKFFDTTGHLRREIGGRVPIGLASLGRHGWIADTMWLTDLEGRRVVFAATSDPRIIRSVVWYQRANTSPHLALPGPLSFYDSPVALYLNGDALVSRRRVSTSGVRAAGPVVVPPRETLIRVGPKVGVDRVIAALADDAGHCEWTPSGPDRGTFGIPFCAQALHTVSSDGAVVSEVIQSNSRGPSGSFRVVTIASSGDTLWSHLYRYVAMAIPARVRDSLETALVARAANTRSVTHSYSSTPDAVGIPHFYPPVRRLLAGDDEFVWVELWTAAPVHRWLRLEPHGRNVGIVELPLDVRLEAAVKRYIWGVQPDPMDRKQDVVRYRLGIHTDPPARSDQRSDRAH